MPTNRQWLYSLEPHELTEWFDAEHTSNDTLSAKKVVSAESVDANDGNVSLKISSDDTQNLTDSREIAETSNNSDENVTDSREKLEADMANILHSAYMYAWMHGHENRRGTSFESLYSEFYNLLDRQAAITERECIDQRIADQISAMWKSQKIVELQAQVDELTAECAECVYKQEFDDIDRLKTERDNLAADLLTCNREREHLREHLGIALDHAHDICSLVDIDGNVLDVGE